ncbi:hypothetical protein [Bacillus paralicheniformis]|uniref:hypothetical protein n=1 Tax=Bacillus paralicheniformis TaxID=1648923 RepID=UPI001CC692FE|nr:hypothetical protein [Bacillus paralicheniformis]
MAESKRESIGKIKIDLDVSDAITGLKAVQREAKAATKALAELESSQQHIREMPSVEDVYYGRIRSEIEYVVIVVDTPGQAQMLEGALRSLNSDRTRFQALHVGQSAVGWQFKGTRPTTVILAYSELTTDQEKKWEREVIGNLGYGDDHPTRETLTIKLL